VADRDKPRADASARLRVLVASSNPGKLREYRELAGDVAFDLDLLPNFPEVPTFEESAPTFAENSAGKALHYSQFTTELVMADDSGLVVPALGGAPGVYSARYAGPDATDGDRILKLLREMNGRTGDERRARFVCVTTLARSGRALAITSDFVEGLVLEEPKGLGGFGYDPIFYSTELGHAFGEASQDEKNRYSHRGKAFRKLFEYLARQIQ
jgi:XTP/dITP diphosphohydrolase